MLNTLPITINFFIKFYYRKPKQYKHKQTVNTDSNTINITNKFLYIINLPVLFNVDIRIVRINKNENIKTSKIIICNVTNLQFARIFYIIL